MTTANNSAPKSTKPTTKKAKKTSIEPVGKQRPKPDPKDSPTSERSLAKTIHAMEDEVHSKDILNEETIHKIKEIASSNPVTNDIIENAKKFTTDYSEKIYKQCTDLVALYNIAHQKPFFFITPAEARLAIDYIKKCREGYISDLEEQSKMDLFVHEFINNLGNVGIDTSTSIHAFDIKLRESIDKDLDKICGLEMKTVTMTGDYLRSHPYNPEEAVQLSADSLNKDSSFGKVKSPKKEELPEYMVYNAYLNGINSKTDLPVQLSLSWINQIFSVIESHDLCVDVILMNAFRISDVRNFGKTVYDEYQKEEYRRRKAFGKMFGAEIYLCNKLENNQVIFGAIAAVPDHAIFLNAMM